MSTPTMKNQDSSDQTTKPWIRGVNIGGWLMLERFITPYLFAITDCDIRGDFHAYPNQIDAPSNATLHTFSSPNASNAWENNPCQPVLPYPVDEWTLASAFPNKSIARAYLRRHWDTFVTKQNLIDIKATGATHIRVPLSHWILGNLSDDEPYVDGGWDYFVRLCGWAKEIGLEVWPDIHTAPGSQNGFDNSGHLLDDGPTCGHWCNSTKNVMRSLDIVEEITWRIRMDDLTSVVTGFGPLNEPFVDCDMGVVKAFDEKAFEIVRRNMGNETMIYVGDMFDAAKWNNGFWERRENTILDSHYYHVFAEEPRALSPRQHIAYVCRKNTRDTEECCYKDPPENTIPAKGISRIIGEWSASFDTLVVDKLSQVMDGIAETGKAPEFDRQISPERQQFLRDFVEAQIVSYEANDKGISRGWFYWTFKVEGGAFAEWDYLRGISEGWIPQIQPTDVASETIFGTCEDIIFRTDDNDDIVDEFPPHIDEGDNWQGVDIDDDVVVSHGQSLLDAGGSEMNLAILRMGLLLVVVIAFFFLQGRWGRKKREYEQVSSVEIAV